MGFFKKVMVMAYMTIMITAGALLLAVGLKVFSPEEWANIIKEVTDKPEYQSSVIVFGCILVLLGLVTAHRVLSKLKAARVISFQNPDGVVTVSLGAVEEYINKLAKDIPDIKEVKPCVTVNKKGININAEVSIFSAANIPEITERIQMKIRTRVQDMLGSEERMNIKMHIKKISKGAKVPGNSGENTSSREDHIPYRDTR